MVQVLPMDHVMFVLIGVTFTVAMLVAFCWPFIKHTILGR